MAGKNLRDRGYPQAKDTTNRSDKRNTPMKNDTLKEGEGFKSEPITEKIPVTSALERLVNAYNNRMYGNPNAPLLNYSHIDSLDGASMNGINVMRQGSPDLSGRLGFVNKWVGPNETSYNIGLDNGSPNRGLFDIAANTPIGSAHAGYEDATNYLSYTSPTGVSSLDAFYWKGGENPREYEFSAGVGTADTGGNDWYVDVNAPFINRDSYRQFSTPLGDVNYGSSATTPANNGHAYAEFTPNQYVQTLLNLLNRGTL